MSEPTWEETEPTWDDTEDQLAPAAPLQPESPDPMTPDKMSAAEAALTTFDPVLLNTMAAGAGAAAGQMVGGPDLGDRPQQEIEKAQVIAEKLKSQGKMKQYENMLANIEDLKKLQSPTKEAFYGGREDFKAREQKAFRDQPGAAFSSTIGSGLLMPIPGAALAKGGKGAKMLSKVLPNLDDAAKIGKLSKRIQKAEKLGLDLAAKKLLKQKRGAQAAAALKDGLKIGALTGAAKGDARLLEGDFEGFARDTIAGAGVGGASSYAFTKTLQGATGLLSGTKFARNIKDAFKLGSRGLDIDKDSVRADQLDIARDYIRTFTVKMKRHGQNLGEFKKFVEKNALNVDTEEGLAGVKKAIDGLEDSTKKKFTPILDTLADFYDGGKEHGKFMNKLEKHIVAERVKDTAKSDMAKVAMQKRQMRETIKKQINNISDEDLGIVSSKDILPEGGPEVQSQVKHTIKEQMTPEGIEQVHKFDSQDVTPFTPSKISRTTDATSGRDIYSVADEGSGKIKAFISDVQKRAIDPADMSYEKALELRNQLGSFLKDDSMKLSEHPELYDAVKNTYKGLKTKLSFAIRNETDRKKLSQMNKVYKAFKDIEDLVKNAGHDRDGRNVLRSMTNFIVGVGNKGDDIEMESFYRALKKVDPKLVNQIKEEIADLRIRHELSGLTSEARSSMMAPSTPRGAALDTVIRAVGNLPKLVYKGSNALGQKVHTVKSFGQSVGKGATSLANRSLSITEASPEQLQGLISQIKSRGDESMQRYLRPLQKALGSKQRTKQAVLFGLSQQQAFIDMINELSSTEELDKEK